MVIQWALSEDLQWYLTAFVRGNRHFRKVSSYSTLLVYEQNIIIVHLDEQSPEYIAKFIEKDFIGYCTALLKLIVEWLQNFVIKHQLGNWNFSFEFRCGDKRFGSTVYYPL